MDFSTTFGVDFMWSVFPHLLEQWQYYTQIQYRSIYIMENVNTHLGI